MGTGQRKEEGTHSYFHGTEEVHTPFSNRSSDEFGVAMVLFSFSWISVKGCLFYWMQAEWRHKQGVGLQEACNKDSMLAVTLMALPFIPHDHVLTVFLLLALLLHKTHYSIG